MDAPAGSDAALSDPTSLTPALTPDVVGTYVLRLTAAQDGSAGPAIDEVRVVGTDANDQMGMPIQTITSAGDVQIGNREPYKQAGSWVKMLVLSADQLLPVNGPWGAGEQSFSPGQSGALAKVLTENPSAGGVDSNHIVILSGQGRPVSLTSSQASDLTKAINAIGGTVASSGPTPGGAADLSSGQWSVIGNRGLTEGHADQNFAMTQAPIPKSAVPDFPSFPDDPGGPGSLTGHMQEVNEDAYQYISHEYVELDTRWTPSVDDAPSRTQNTIKVGDANYPSDPIADGAIGIQVLVLDPSAPLTKVDHKTFQIINPDGSQNYPGIFSLDQMLHQYVTDPGSHTAGNTKLVVLQDFGENGGTTWPGATSTDWLQDDLPNVCCQSWQGGGYPQGQDLYRLWNRLNAHGFGSVAGNIGVLAGPEYHDVVANYRRPYVDDATGKVRTRNYGGLTVVASTNRYQASSAFAQGQPTPAAVGDKLANGRVTGILRRNEQSQWELESSALGAGWASSQQPDSATTFNAKALWDLVFAAPKPWPCTPEHLDPCPVAAELAAAHKHFVQLASPKSTKATLRDLYGTYWKSDFDVSAIQDAQYPGEGHGFSEDTFTKLKAQLLAELGHVGQVKTGIQDWQQFFVSNAQGGAIVNVQKVGGDIATDLQKVYRSLMSDRADVDGAGIASDALLVLSSVIDVGLIASGNPEAIPVAAPALGGLAAIISLGQESYDATQTGMGESVANDTDAIRDQVSNLSIAMYKRYAAISATMEHFGGVFASDSGKLEAAAANFAPGGPWALPDDSSQVRMGQSIEIAAGTAAYEGLLPLAFSQWIISPHHTQRNGLAARDLPAKDYRCQDNHGDSQSDTRNPFRKSTPTWGMISVARSGAPARDEQNYAVRALKWRADDMDADTPDEDNTGAAGLNYEVGLNHSGKDPPGSLLRPLFGPVSAFGEAGAPGPYGASKEEIFGQGDWRLRKLQCGNPR